MNKQRKNKLVNRKTLQFMNKKSIAILIVVTVIIIFNISFGSFLSDAHDKNEITNITANQSNKCYKSIEIKEGDTLWSIANEYRNKELVSTTEYIQELKQINSLYSDDIQAEQYLTISYNEKTL
ncbi:MAG: LysM peptidoglycan-binding domain-containing protein [Lachnospiraceae bacterium]